MNSLPIIVVSSPKEKIGSSVLALNLAGALWNDGYKVGLLSSDASETATFLKERAKFSQAKNAKIFMPKQIQNLTQNTEIDAIVADIKAKDYQQYEEVFNQAHTLITPLNSENDISWQANDAYLNFIWKIKKNQAARGVKYLNWILVPYLKQNTTDFSDKLQTQAKRFGFKIAPAIYYRDEYMHINEGYCASDLRDKKLEDMMSLKDVYARREILQLTDFIWK